MTYIESDSAGEFHLTCSSDRDIYISWLRVHSVPCFICLRAAKVQNANFKFHRNLNSNTGGPRHGRV